MNTAKTISKARLAMQNLLPFIASYITFAVLLVFMLFHRKSQ